MSDETDREAAEVILVAETGSDLAGALAGTAVGLIGGPAGAFAGAAVGVFVSRAARRVVGRFHARERVRAGAALDLIAIDAQDRKARGETRRDDGFFEPRGELRPDGEELLEAVLMQAANAWEERKVALLARLYSSVAHDASVVPADANFLVSMAGDLTYRQFVALGALSRIGDYTTHLMRAEALREERQTAPEHAVVLELDDLGDRRLVGMEEDGRVYETGSDLGVLGAISIQPWTKVRLTAAGALLARLTGAGELPAEERDAWVRAFTGTDFGK